VIPPSGSTLAAGAVALLVIFAALFFLAAAEVPRKWALGLVAAVVLFWGAVAWGLLS
jgi:hypothetical protein